jgi:hypothetical protein
MLAIETRTSNNFAQILDRSKHIRSLLAGEHIKSICGTAVT